jgi:hypothetical protein
LQQDAAPPVVSLRLDANPLNNNAAHSCEVYDREAPESGATPACEDPVCDAHDHHEGTLDCMIQVEMINNNGSTAVADLGSKSSCSGEHSFSCTADRKKRSQWLYHYGAADSQGNEAEEVTFVLTIYDHEEPSLTKPVEFINDIYHDNDPRAEACNMYNTTAPTADPFAGLAPCVWTVPPTAIAMDNVDDAETLAHRIYVGTIEPGHTIGEGSFGVRQHNTNAIEINTHILGDWRVRWEVCDTAGIYGQHGADNCIAEETVVHVVDTQPPVLELHGQEVLVLECGIDNYNEDGAKCMDLRDSWVDGGWRFDSGFTVQDHGGNVLQTFDNDLSAITVRATFDSGLPNSGGKVQQQGTFHVQYDCQDTQSNNAATVQRTVEVRDTRDPHVSLTSGITEVQLSAGATVHEGPGNPYENGNAQIDWDLVESAAVCQDDCTATHIDAKLHYGNCSSAGATVGNGELSASNWALHADLVPGFYSVKFVCSDQATPTPHAHSTCLTLVNVDKSKPIIALLGNSTAHLEAAIGVTYDDEGATCSDQVDGMISQNVEVSGDIVNLAKVGVYTVLYECTDAAGNDAIPLPRTVIVRHSACPTCTIYGSQTLDHEAGFAFTDAGVQCSDLIDGPCIEGGQVDGTGCVTLPVEVTRAAVDDGSPYSAGVVDENQVGTYFMTYRAANSVGSANDDAACANAPHHYVRTVEIKDTLAPVIRLAYNGDMVAHGQGNERSTTTGQTANVRNPFSSGHHTQLEGGHPFSSGHWSSLMAEQVGDGAGSWLIGAAAAGAAGIALLALSSRKASGTLGARPPV